MVKVGTGVKKRGSEGGHNALPRALAPPPGLATGPRLRLPDDRAMLLPF